MPAFWRRLVAAALAITPLLPVAAAAAEKGGGLAMPPLPRRSRLSVVSVAPGRRIHRGINRHLNAR